MTYTRMTIAEELAAYRRLRRKHNRDCLWAFAAGAGTAFTVLLAFLELTGGW